jgi:ABC-type phosphate transport system substrate-binding protein
MRLKSPKLPGSLKLRGAIAIGMAFAAAGGIAIAQTTPAVADPTVTLVAVGSDTVQDVYNQFALDAGGNLLGSYNATNPVTNAVHEIITPVDGFAGVNCSFARPDGSSEGVANLRLAINPASTNASAAVAPVAGQGCVDIARSSSGPGTLQSDTGTIVYVPFALDAVGDVTGPASCTSTTCPSFTADVINATTGAVTTQTVTPSATAITTANDFTLTDLETLYDDCDTVTEGGVTYWPLGSSETKPAGAQQIDLYIPQSGSGTRSFWASTLGFNATTPPACDFDVIQNGPLAGENALVEENDGTAYATDPDALGPFSIAQWISQRNGHDDRRHGVVENNIGGVSPFSNGNSSTGALNSSFPITRDVYSVVSYARVTTTTDPLYGLLNSANGAGAFLCSDASQILSYGFALLSTCGDVLTANRAEG